MEGYARVTELMASHEEFAILRQFKALNYQNLLYLQAELTHLEEELRELAYKDASRPGRVFFARDWWSLARTRGRDARRQWKKVLKVRRQLNENSSYHSPICLLPLFSVVTRS